MIVRVIRPGAVTGLWQLAVPDADLVSVPADLLLPIQEASGRNTELLKYLVRAVCGMRQSVLTVHPTHGCVCVSA